MQAYGTAFARVYNALWAGFARDLAPRIFEFYSHSQAASAPLSLLDLCCGTGQLSRFFLEQGYHVTGIDLSAAMLHYAADNNREFVQSGQARFIQGDAAAFTLDASFGLIVSTFDALNHLKDWDALRGCFQSVRAVCRANGMFIFDLNTRKGLKRWNTISVTENDDILVVNRGIYDGGEKAYAHINGFVRDEDGRYTRFEETVYNTAFDMARVRGLLLEVGWREAHFARASNFAAPLDEPEHEERVYIVASA